jgi:hypothetical protein
MNVDEEICLSDESGNLSEISTHDSENNLDIVEISEDKRALRKGSDKLGAILPSGVVRPLSPTLKIHSLENVIPGVAMLYEGFDDMREWRNTIEFVRFFAEKKNMFNRRHHWDMRAKFLQARLKCMERIVEVPNGAQQKPVGGFFVHDPVAVEKVMEGKLTKTALACEEKNIVTKDAKMSEHCSVDQQQCTRKELPVDIEKKSCGKEQSLENHVDTRHEIRKQEVNARKNFTTTSRAKMDSNRKVKKIDIWIPNQMSYIEDSYMLENPTKTGHVLPESSPMMRNQRRVQKENILENTRENCTVDEKLKRDSLEKELNLETERDARRAATSMKCGNYPPDNDTVQDLRVIGQSIHLNSSIELVNDHCFQSTKESETVNLSSEKLSSEDHEELVLEDVSDQDFIPHVSLPSSYKLKHAGLKKTQGITEIFSTNNERENLNKQIERESVTRLQRLRKRISNLFSCFAKNRVTPVDI